MSLPSFPNVEGGRDFDEEVEDRIRLTQAYNSRITDSNTRALSARGVVRTAEVETGVGLLAGQTEKKPKTKHRRDKTLTINE